MSATAQFTKAYNEVQRLITSFEAGINHYLSPNYQEAEVRKEYIDKFFTALGWDVNHDEQKNPFEQEVKIEKAQRQQGALGQKRADYAFFLAPNYKRIQFFVEAKKPSRMLRQNKDDYFQTAKYGWNAGTGVSILTDFEELVIIDCRFQPDVDTILHTEIKYYKYTDFKDADVFDELYWVFSREALVAGNLPKYIEELPKPKALAKQLKLFGGKYQSIDESFLNYIDQKRFDLAVAFNKNTPNLDAHSLTEATQRTIDRIVFIRFLEDKLIETENIIHNIANSTHPWAKFVEYSRHLDTKYNGVVFKPLFIDDKKFAGANNDIFRELCSALDHTNTPYDFNYIPIHILGSIYERFLGKVVLIKNGKATIDYKPEVRKAGGVFYTPKYIVDYIVKNTVGKIIEGKTPKQIEELSFADISCGSGSFLIGVFEYLLDYHNAYYNKYPSKAKAEKCKYNQDLGVYVMSIQQKQRILLNNIYGVDIDAQATEVTQLSLFLKMLEDETTSSTNDMMVLFHEKILPNLSNNIKCGNSLIGTEILTYKLDLDLDHERKLNPFDFESAFAKVFKNGGFDAIIGNPPYVKEYTEREIFENIKLGKLHKYYQGKMDLWYFFACYGLDILKENGLLAYIIPNNWVSNSGASILRNKVINDAQIVSMVNFNDFMVFKEAAIQTMIINLRKTKIEPKYQFLQQVFNQKKHVEIEVTEDLANETAIKSIITFPKIERKKNLDAFLKFDNNKDTKILNKIFKSKNFELELKEATNGIHPHHAYLNAKMVEVLNKKYSLNTGVFALNKEELDNLKLDKKEKKIIKPFYSDTSLLKKYYCNPKNEEYLIYTDSSFKKDKIIEYPKIKAHLDKFKKIITSDNKPYGLHRAREERFFIADKIVVPRKCKSPSFIYCDFDAYFSAAFYIIATQRINLKYLTAIFNSNLIKFWLLKKGKMQGSIYQIDKEPLLQIPIQHTTNKKAHDQIVTLVEQMLNTKSQQQQAVTERDKVYLEQKCATIDMQINTLVYQLYDITDDEIKEIELAII